MEKVKVRNNIIKKRDSILLDTKQNYDYLIYKQLINCDIYKKSKKIFTYISFGSEVDTTAFINYALNDKKEIYVPKTDKEKREMKAIKINNLDNMIVDKWGIPEPINVEKSEVGEVFDLIIMPGLAFDKNGNRIGYGGGYYDKYLSQIKGNSHKMVLAYDFQIVERIESEIHDIKVEYIITNNDYIHIK